MFTRAIISPAIPAEPRGIYAASKVWLESLARVYSNTHGMSCICIRIGQVERDRPRPPQGADIYVSQRDITQIWEKAITATDDVRFGVFYGMSKNDHRWTDISAGAEVLGFEPEDRAEEHTRLYTEREIQRSGREERALYADGVLP